MSVNVDLLINKRSQVLADLAKYRSEIEILTNLSETKRIDQDVYLTERGGDASLVKLTKDQIERLGQESQDTVSKQPNQAKTKKKGVIKKIVQTNDHRSEEQRDRRSNRMDNKEVSHEIMKDAEAFSDARGCRPAPEVAGVEVVDTSTFLLSWSKFDQDDDKLCHLDVDTLEDLFESSGVLLTDEEAKLCLSSIYKSQLGKYNFKDILKWHEIYSQSKSNRTDLSQWQQVVSKCYTSYTEYKSQFYNFLRKLNLQRIINDQTTERYKIELEKIRVANMTKDELEKEQSEGKKGNYTEYLKDKILGEMKGSGRLSGWQRQQILNPPATIKLRFEFGKDDPEEVIEVISEDNLLAATKTADKFLGKDKKGNGKNENKKEVPKSTKKVMEGKKTQDEINKEKKDNEEEPKLKFLFEAFTRPPALEASISETIDSHNYIHNINKLQPLDFLTRYKYVRTGLFGESDESYGSVAWFGIEINPTSTIEEIICLKTTAENFFNTLSWDHRCHIYTSVKVDIFHVAKDEDEEDEEEKKVAVEAPPLKEGEVPKTIHPRRILMITLLHEVDQLHELESLLPARLLITRALRNFKVELNVKQSFIDLYKNSLEFENFKDRLFGPQEDELGEEGMNPLRFAKMCRQRKNAAQDAIEKAQSMKIEELKDHCRSHGLSDKGVGKDLIARVKSAYTRQAETVGFGELSAFGAEIIEKIYQQFNRTNPSKSGINFWDMNRMLCSIDSETIFDIREYRKIMEEQQLLVDKDGYLTLEGLIAYYELFGRLADDMTKLNYGSLDDFIKGNFESIIEYEAEAVNTVIELLESHTTSYVLLKNITNFISSCDNITIESKFTFFSEIFHSISDKGWGLSWIKDLKEAITKPGYFSQLIHKLSEYGADGDTGLIRSLRIWVLNEFGKYNEWETIFNEKNAQIHANLDRIKAKQKKNQEKEEAETKKKLMAAASGTGELPPSVEHNDDDDNDNAEAHDIINWIQGQISQLLPLVVGGKESSNEQISEIVAKIERLKHILGKTSGGVRLTVSEREVLNEMRQGFEKTVDVLRRQMAENKKLLGAHMIAFYDSFRLYATGIATIGCGTKEVCLRGSTIGFDFSQFLPLATGERCLVRQLREEKIKRATQRKNAALAAMDRERMRRNMTAEDIEEMKKAKALAMADERNLEEKNIYESGYSLLTFAREERKSNKEILAMLGVFEKLSAMKSNRYPKSLKVCVAENNVASIMMEFFTFDHPRGNEIVTIFEKASDLTIKNMEKYEPFRTIIRELEKAAAAETAPKVSLDLRSKSEEENDDDEEEEEVIKFPENLITPCILLLQNYISMIRHAKNIPKIDKAKNKILLVLELFEFASETVQQGVKRGIAKPYNDMPVYTILDFGKELEKTLETAGVLRGDFEEDGESMAEKASIKAEADRLAQIQKDKDEVKEGELYVDEFGNLQTKVSTKEELAEKRKKQEKEKIERKKQVSKQIAARHKLYQLIQTNEISAIFEEKATKNVIGGPVKWGVDKKVLYDPFSDTPVSSVHGSERGDSTTRDDVTFDNSTILTQTMEMGQDSMILDNASIYTYGSIENDNTTASASFQMKDNLERDSIYSNDNATAVASGSGVGLVKWLKGKF